MNEATLPNGWAIATIDDLIGSQGIFRDGDWVESKDQDQNGQVRLVQLADIGDGEFRDKSSRFLTTDKAGELNCTFLQTGDILVARMPDPLGRACIFSLHGNNKFVTVVDVCVIRFGSDFVDARYFMYVLNSPMSRRKISDHQTGSTRKRISRGNLSTVQFPIAPLNEQHRIVAKIEELFSELDKGVESLKAAKAQLKVYRQALLKHAFEGKLTARWRAENRDKLEPAEALLKRIQQERAQRYQQQLAKWEAKGRPGNKPKALKPLPPLTAEELAELPELPEGWVYAYLSDLGDLGRGKSKHRPRNDPRLFGGVYPFVQTGEVKAANKIIRQFSQTLSDFGLQQSKLWPSGTLCITIAANIAETAFLGFEGCFPDSVVGFSAFKKTIAPEYVDFFIQAARTRIEAYAPATAQKNINLETLGNLVVPYCCSDEQKQILNILEERFSNIDQLELTLTTSLQQAEALRQSILKKAFSGQLVAQDANDEPATELLARIKAEKAAQAMPAKLSKSRKAAVKSAPTKTNVIPFPTRIPGISPSELHAGIMALAYQQHELSRRTWYFGHVKAEKISHMVESFAGIDLGRQPIKDAAGPNDFKRLLAVESLAREQKWFDVQKQKSGRHVLHKMEGFDDLIGRTSAALGEHLDSVKALIGHFIDLNKTRSEIVATLYAAWNNLLLLGRMPSDKEIVLEATENWHEDKLKIRRERFFNCLGWMRNNGLVPTGRGRYVAKKGEQPT